MAIAGYKVRLRKSGDSTAISAEATTSLGSQRYQITTAARRCLNPDVDFSVLDTGATIAYSGIATIQWEFGIVTLVSAPGGAVTFNGAYFPLTTASEDIAEGKDFSLSLTGDLLDTTVWGQEVRSRLQGLKDASVSLNVISSPASYSAAFAAFSNGTRICLEIDPDRSSSGEEVFRAFGKLESVEKSGSVDGLIESSMSFKVDSNKNSRGFGPGYAWG